MRKVAVCRAVRSASDSTTTDCEKAARQDTPHNHYTPIEDFFLVVDRSRKEIRSVNLFRRFPGNCCSRVFATDDDNDDGIGSIRLCAAFDIQCLTGIRFNSKWTHGIFRLLLVIVWTCRKHSRSFLWCRLTMGGSSCNHHAQGLTHAGLMIEQ